MTLEERIIVSAYTGYLMCDFSKVHEYVENKLGRPVWTHEFGIPRFQEEIQSKIRDEFLSLCGNEDSKKESAPCALKAQTAPESECVAFSIQHGIGICMGTKEMETTLCRGDLSHCERIWAHAPK